VVFIIWVGTGVWDWDGMMPAELSLVRKRRQVSYLMLPSTMAIWGSPASLWNYAEVFATLRGVRLLQLPFKGLVENIGDVTWII
jgi:hypothetical protein